MNKQWYQSKTVWFNVVTMLLTILSLTELQEFIPAKYLALINGIGNVILRVWFTGNK